MMCMITISNIGIFHKKALPRNGKANDIVAQSN